MRNVISAIRNFVRDEEGQDIIEYGLLAAFIAIVTALLLVLFKDPITAIYQRILDYLNAANANLPNGP
jgi:Flp pilus assembly pilin Flp